MQHQRIRLFFASITAFPSFLRLSHWTQAHSRSQNTFPKSKNFQSQGAFQETILSIRRLWREHDEQHLMPSNKHASGIALKQLPGGEGRRSGEGEPERKCEIVQCPVAMKSGSLCPSIVGVGVRKRGNREVEYSKREWMCVVYGRVGRFRCSLYILLSLPLVRCERTVRRTGALPHS